MSASPSTPSSLPSPSFSSALPSAATRHASRDILRLVGAALLTGLAASAVLMAAILFLASSAYAQPAGEDIRHGVLLLHEEDGRSRPALLLDTVVHADLSGLMGRVKVVQTFRNPDERLREGIYAFPLPDTAVVDRLEMKIGERRIQGQIKERQEARQIYEQAKQDGRKAALVEQWRPNLFTTSVAPIGGGETIVVEIEYQQSLRYDQGVFSWRFPLAITPRYSPDACADCEGSGGVPDEEISGADIAAVPLMQMPLRIDGADHRAAHYPVRFDIVLTPGAPIHEVSSAYHEVTMKTLDGSRYQIALKDGTVPADRDFELRWTPQTGHAPATALFTERYAGDDYWYLMLMPPAASEETQAPMQREVTFIIDTSGSMSGTPLIQAQEALSMALERLHPGDFFNVIEFNSRTRALFAAPVAADAKTLAAAQRFVAQLRADGGTEMYPALQRAFSATPQPGLIGQVVFLTDGAVSGEEQLFELIRTSLHERRLFTVGIGSAPNAYFMRRAAEFGRGTFTFISDAGEVSERMMALFQKLEAPALTGIETDWQAFGATVEMWPTRIGDLYQGEPVVVVARTPAADGATTGALAVRGARQGGGWQSAAALDQAIAVRGVAGLWAQRKIEALLDEGARHRDQDETTRAAVVELALKHHLVSRFTSLVAVDVTPSVAANAGIDETVLPPAMPAGLSMAGMPATATPAAWQALGGALALFLALALFRRPRFLTGVTGK